MDWRTFREPELVTGVPDIYTHGNRTWYHTMVNSHESPGATLEILCNLQQKRTCWCLYRSWAYGVLCHKTRATQSTALLATSITQLAVLVCEILQLICSHLPLTTPTIFVLYLVVKTIFQAILAPIAVYVYSDGRTMILGSTVYCVACLESAAAHRETTTIASVAPPPQSPYEVSAMDKVAHLCLLSANKEYHEHTTTAPDDCRMAS